MLSTLLANRYKTQNSMVVMAGRCWNTRSPGLGLPPAQQPFRLHLAVKEAATQPIARSPCQHHSGLKTRQTHRRTHRELGQVSGLPAEETTAPPCLLYTSGQRVGLLCTAEQGGRVTIHRKTSRQALRYTAGSRRHAQLDSQVERCSESLSEARVLGMALPTSTILIQ